MRLVTFRANGQARLGAALDAEAVVDLARAQALAVERGVRGVAQPLASDCVALLTAGTAGLECARRVLAWVGDGADLEALAQAGAVKRFSDVELLPPVAQPPKVLCVGRNYAEHVADIGERLPTHPVIFPRYASTLIGHGSPIVRPWVSDQLDWEGELACVIGQRARHVDAADAYRIVAGYSLFNDVSVRDFQLRGQQYTPGKNFDNSGPFGPALVTSEEISDPEGLELTVKLNGEVVQSAITGEMIFGIPALIADISSWITLEPGDLIVTGTPAGTGHSRVPHRFLVPGDRVRIEIPQLGVLENPVEQESEPGA
jgi:acylpyruvate hydrolase